MKPFRVVVYIAVVLATFGAGWHFGQHESGTVHAETNITVPKSYGTLRGTGLPLLLFEAPDGTVRLVSASTGHPEVVVLRK